MASIRHKHVVLDQKKLDKARRALRTRSERETLEKALDLVITDAELDGALKRAGGRASLEKVYR